MGKPFTKFGLLLFMCALTGCKPAPVHEDKTAPSATQESFDADKAWEEFKAYFDLFYAYSDKMDFDVPAALDGAQARALKSRTKGAFRTELTRLGHVFGDPHIVIGPLENTDFNMLPTSSDIRVRFSGGGYIVEDVRARSAADVAQIRPGSVIRTVDGLPIDVSVSNMFAGLVDTPTARQKSHVATLLVNGKRSGGRSLTFENGETFTLSSPRIFAKSLQSQPVLSVSYDDDIAIIRFHNSLGNNETIKAFDKAMDETADAAGLILDMRETPSGGNTEVGRSIIGHFVKTERPYQTHMVPSLEREFTVPRKFTEYVLPRKPYRVASEAVVLGSYWTGSMGEGVVIGLDGAADMHVIASDMGDLLGGLSNYNLNQSGIRLDLPSETLSHIDGTPREDFVADIPLVSADRDALGGDPAMDAALLYLRSEKKTP